MLWDAAVSAANRTNPFPLNPIENSMVGQVGYQKDFFKQNCNSCKCIYQDNLKENKMFEKATFA